MNVTAWTKWNEPDTKRGTPGRWSFNHIEDGHALTDTPADAFSRGWSRSKWQRQHGHLQPQPGRSPLLVVTEPLDHTPPGRSVER